ASGASPSARAHRCSTATSPRTRPSPSWNTSRTAAASARPAAWSRSTRTPSGAWGGWPANTPGPPTTSSWPFPPSTRRLQLEVKWSFVAKQEARRGPDDERDVLAGDQWDFVALGPDSRLVLSVVVGKRLLDNAALLLEDVKPRLAGAPELITSD